MRSARTALAFLLTLTALGGCTSRSDKDDAILFDIAGPVAVLVESFNGNVDIEADDRLKQATVEVERAADYGYMRQKDSKRSLETIQYTATLESTATGPVLTVKAWSDHPESHRQRAHVKIRLPATDGVTIHTTRGRVYAKNCQGPADISTTEHDVRYMTNWAVTQPVSIANRDADIDFRVRGESMGAFDASTVDGKVVARVTHGEFIIRARTALGINAVLNDGANPVKLATEDGDVRIAVVPNPTEVGLYIVEP